MLRELRAEAPQNLLSKYGKSTTPYPPVVTFKPKKTAKAFAKDKLAQMAIFQQPEGYPALVTATQTGYVVVWDAESGLKFEAFNVGKGNTMTLGASVHGDILAVGGLGCFVELYKMGDQFYSQMGHDTSLSICRNTQQVNTSASGRASQFLSALSGHDAAISSVSFLDEMTIVSGGFDNKLIVWDLTYGEAVYSSRDSSAIEALDTHRGLIATGSHDGSLKLWDIRDRLGIPIDMAASKPVNNVKFMPDGNTILASSSNGIQLLDMRTTSELEAYKLKAGSLTKVDVSSSGRLAVVGTDTGLIIPLDLYHHRWLPPIERWKDRVSGLAVWKDTIYSACRDGSIRSHFYEQ